MAADACIHGRFQVFHNDHLTYLLQALQHYNRLIIGITSVTGLRGRNLDSHRHQPAHNPFTYFERTEMIHAAIEAHPEINPARISFSPFPIDHPELLPEFIPHTTICYTTIQEPWNAKKVELLKSLGYQVSILPTNSPKALSSTRVRELIRQYDDSWKDLVPEAIASHLEANDMLERIRNC